tara:strand:- start:79 stop:291 length:213 start_codon:yes stop_codon:yes gene_type:complete
MVKKLDRDSNGLSFAKKLKMQLCSTTDVVYPRSFLVNTQAVIKNGLGDFKEVYEYPHTSQIANIYLQIEE